jgi:hypothetical protein
MVKIRVTEYIGEYPKRDWSWKMKVIVHGLELCGHICNYTANVISNPSDW